MQWISCLTKQFYQCVAFVGKSELQLNYYSENCPKAEEIIQEEVTKLYYKHGNTAVSWLRNLFHDCIVKVINPANLKL